MKRKIFGLKKFGKRYGLLMQRYKQILKDSDIKRKSPMPLNGHLTRLNYMRLNKISENSCNKRERC